MKRCALSLSVVMTLLMAPTASAEGTRSLGVTLSPVGGFLAVLDREPSPLNPASAYTSTGGYSASVDWSFRGEGARFFVGGHVSASALETEMTPLSVRFMPLPRAYVKAYLGVGGSVLFPTSASTGDTNAVSGMSFPVRLGLEGSAGVDVPLTGRWFLSAQARYQDFSQTQAVFSALRQKLMSGYLGVGVTL